MRFVDVMDDFTGYIRIPILEVGYSMLCTLGLNNVRLRDHSMAAALFFVFLSQYRIVLLLPSMMLVLQDWYTIGKITEK
jgi:hypothetical protein